MTVIETSRLVLRDFTPLDLDAYRRIRDDAKFRRFYSDEDADPGRTEALLKMFIDQGLERPRTKYQFAVTSQAGELMGSCGVRLESDGQASVGCELGRKWHMSGVAAEASAAVIDFGFRKLAVDRVCARTLLENRAAVRLCRSLGMRIEPEASADTLLKNRSWTTVVLSLTSQQWHARASSRQPYRLIEAS